jgi:hypothetical protein
MAHNQEVVGSIPDTVYWMDARNYINPHESKKNKGSQMRHTKKNIILKNRFLKGTNGLTVPTVSKIGTSFSWVEFTLAIVNRLLLLFRGCR